MQVADVEIVRSPSKTRFADVIALGKPRLSSLVLCTAAAGLWLAPAGLPWWRALTMLVATAVLIGSANALNSFFEREIDGRMKRTRARPLPSRLVEPRSALYGALVVGALSALVIGLSSNVLTAVLGIAAFVIYGFVYTPMKRTSSLALFVGAVPGAIPPLMGWTAVTGQIDAIGMALFGVLFFWQLPHFVAISVYLGDDYERGGLKVFSNVYGEVAARATIVATAFMLIPVTWALVPLGAAGPLYGWLSFLLGLAFGVWTLVGVGTMKIKRWARRVFLGSLVYLTVYLAVLALTAG
ncbi:MAG: heme o synthase [Myxococcota bacterium]